MNSQIILAILLTVLPVFEIRAGLPIAIDYAIKNNLAIWPFAILLILVNILAVFIAFFFLDFLHKILLKINFYKKFTDKFLKKTQRKSKKIKNRMDKIGYLALMFFVAIPLPGSGAWTGSLIAWTLRLDRKNSIIAISAGVIVAGLITLLISLGFFLF